ncbi:hypothetical protein B0H15DRAFT_237232 [Mycena belliarum]|uniref:Transcription activator of gluconeogenesis ERT1 n=1 Tax=Mycena belliarum TaxID=1033014 RepID=A0AAD6XQ83_9AGAR|nr:hypothetical protein B0H15DRAFT_237232 [Mycena belliae]
MDPVPPPPGTASGSSMHEPDWPRRIAKACSNCRRDKVRCDGACRRARARCERTGAGAGAGCVRCGAEKIECVEEEPLPAPSVRPGTPPSPGAGARERTKSACKSCKTDNKKCDNERPCARCVARSETCVALERPKQARLRCEGCRKLNLRCEDARPCQNCVELKTECINVVRQTRGSSGNRVKAACISCRRTKVRCDGAANAAR